MTEEKSEEKEKPDFDRDELVKKVRDLENKETWVRKNLREFLEMWAEVTEDLPDDPKIEYHEVAKTNPVDDYGYSYALAVKKDYIVSRENRYNSNKNYSKQKIKWMDMGQVHKIVDNLPQELERFYNRLGKRDEEYEEAQEKLENLLRYKP